jgi:hypothetical protein
MASDGQETLFDIFQALSAQQGESAAPPAESEISVTTTLDRLMSEVTQLSGGGGQGSSATAAGTPGDSAPTGSEPDVINVSAEAGSRLNTAPTTESINSNPSSGSSGGGISALSIASSVLGSGLGIIPLVGGLISLFSGGTSQPPPLERYVMPDQLYFTGDDTPDGIQDADYDQFGMPRLYNDVTSGSGSQMSSSTAAPGAGASQSASPSTPGGINVTIQALDSQSFLDRSSDIAQAVRQAMLSSNSINDVVNDL